MHLMDLPFHAHASDFLSIGVCTRCGLFDFICPSLSIPLSRSSSHFPPLCLCVLEEGGGIGGIYFLLLLVLVLRSSFSFDSPPSRDGAREVKRREFQPEVAFRGSRRKHHTLKMVYALLELPAGVALFKVDGERRRLKAMLQFKSTADALATTTQVVNGELSKPVRKFLKKNLVEKEITEELAVADSKLAKAIKETLAIPCVHGDETLATFRALRANIDALLQEVSAEQLNQTALGLAHNLNRYKLKFSPDKVDMMVVQAVALLEDLDKEINKYAMRAREWYGWHFPELAKIVNDNLLYAKIVLAAKTRFNVRDIDFSDFLEEELEQKVKDAAMVSMGTEIAEEDIENICRLCSEVVAASKYRETLSAYLSSRMQTIAPNLTTMVGEQIGARLIQKAGSLLSLAKYPSSTVQILGAEKALFRALKQRQATPKYGILYNAQVVAKAAAPNKGTMSRVLAAKTSLSARIDSFGEGDNAPALEYRSKVEERLRQFEEGVTYGHSGNARGGGARLQQKRAYPNGGDNSNHGGGGAPYKRARLNDGGFQQRK